jgi:hypothetical protein
MQSVENAYPDSQHSAGSIRYSEDTMRILIAAAMFSALAFSPASAAMMACTSDNMAKTSNMMTTMAEGPAKMATAKEMGMTNTAMSTGKMGMACKHYMNAQKMSMMK